MRKGPNLLHKILNFRPSKVDKKMNFAEIMAIKKWQNIESMQFYINRELTHESDLFHLKGKNGVQWKQFQLNKN